ncbi:MAG: VOC family protein [Propionibacteriaceae bacterium]
MTTMSSSNTDTLAAGTSMGLVTLRVADLDAMTSFYHQGIGLSVLAQHGDSALLGRQGVPVLFLQHEPDLRHAPAGHAGLFHTAIVYDTAADLAASVYSVARLYPRSFTGSSDHLVSEAFYFDDPEGNGVELYVDRPRNAWTWHDGTVAMDTLWLDPNAYLQTHLDDLDSHSTAGLGVGHVHLKVGNIARARDFYVDTLGFDVTAAFGDQALFVSAGGYHHHVGMNTWQSRGAGPRTPALGLGQVSLTLPTTEEVARVTARLRDRGVDVADDGATFTFDDPWQNEVRLTAG